MSVFTGAVHFAMGLFCIGSYRTSMTTEALEGMESDVPERDAPSPLWKRMVPPSGRVTVSVLLPTLCATKRRCFSLAISQAATVSVPESSTEARPFRKASLPVRRRMSLR